MITNLLEVFQQGGFWMYTILAFQIMSIVLIVERVYALYFKRKENQMDYVATFEDPIRQGKLQEVLEKAELDKETTPIASALAAGAKAARNFGGKDEIQGKMDESLLFHNGLLEKRVGFLSMIGNVATLTGLLGTITGMSKAFFAVAEASPAEKAVLLAGGISEAMNTTAYGLIVAIPALVAFAILQNRSNTLSEDLNQAALKVYNWLSYTLEFVEDRRGENPATKAEGVIAREITV